MKKQIMGIGKKRMYLFVRRLFAAAAAGILLALSCNSVITVESNGVTYSQYIRPFDNRTFEESELFCDILREELRGITRMAVIKSQLETNDSYDGEKIIDVAAYAHRQEQLPEAAATASFYLDDLIKWGNYGFVTESVYATEDEINSYFWNGSSPFSLQSDLTGGNWKQQSEELASRLKMLIGQNEEETLSVRMISELPSSAEDYMQMAEALGKEVNEEDIIRLDILLPRYLSVDGLDLAEYASDAEEYVRLREDLKTTSKELFINFSEYSENSSAYSMEKSNIRYCYMMMVDGQKQFYTNLPETFWQEIMEDRTYGAAAQMERITKAFQDMGKYVSYNADRAQIETDTGLTAEQMKQELSYYQYAFGDNTRVWLAVDQNYPAKDSFFAAREAFLRLMPNYWYLAGGMVFFAVASLLILLRLTRFEGRRSAENEAGYEIVLERADKMATEPFLLGGILSIGAVFAGCYWGYLFCAENLPEALHSIWLPVVFGAVIFAADILFMFFYLSTVRRIKAHTLWSNSLLLQLAKKMKSMFLALYDNSNILLRALLPFAGLLLCNLLLGSLLASEQEKWQILGFLIAVAIDGAAVILLYLRKKTMQDIVSSTLRIGQGEFDLTIDTKRLHGENRALAQAVNGLGTGIKTAVEQSMKDERLKADLITNVSHDIKTPLTSIINFVNLLKAEKIEDQRIQGYIAVLDAKSQRLRQLTDDLVEASKITSGNISLQMERINFTELVHQTCGEFSDKFREKCLEMVLNLPEKPVMIEADSRRIWRVVENLFSNAYKYALEGTRVYLDIRIVTENGREMAAFSMKNISAQALNIDASELTERFIRGDISRSTEGSGLGLSIAKNLTQLQNGRFEIYLDGDLFKVLLTFPLITEASKLPNCTL